MTFGALQYLGSSPRVRGTQVDFEDVEDKVRFIPACAGNTRRVFPEHLHLSVHPRVCGEHVCYSH